MSEPPASKWFQPRFQRIRYVFLLFCLTIPLLASAWQYRGGESPSSILDSLLQQAKRSGRATSQTAKMLDQVEQMQHRTPLLAFQIAEEVAGG